MKFNDLNVSKVKLTVGEKMKALVLFAAALFAMSCTNQAPTSSLKTDKEKVSYVIGQQVGTSLKNQKIDLDVNAFSMSVSDAVSGKKPAMTDTDMQAAMMKFQSSMMEKMKGDGAKNKADGEAFLAKNKTAEGVKVTESGLQYKVIKSGKGPSPKKTDTVTAHYAGHLIDGTEFDSSYKRDKPADFPVGGVIPGWTEALQMMKVGDKWQLFIPSQLGYGEQGRPGIPSNSVLVFDVELLGIAKASKEKGQ